MIAARPPSRPVAPEATAPEQTAAEQTAAEQTAPELGVGSSAEGAMKVVFDERHRLHNPRQELENSRFQPPFEHPARADFILDALRRRPVFNLVDAAEHPVAAIEAVHEPGLVAFLENAWAEYQAAHGPTHDVIPDVFTLAALTEGMFDPAEPAPIGMRLGWWCFETTTPLTEGTYLAARSAVDVALTSAERVLGGDAAVYGLCRPPGHHAPVGAYGGYCFFNNAAIAAQHLASETGERVTVLDIDYHHGNGTQQIFYQRPDVQFVSLHGDPARAFPYLTGHRDEVGTGRGRGTTTNYPLPVAADDQAVATVLTDALEKIDRFDPAMVVVSLGLDTYYDDPISDLAVSTAGFGDLGRLIGETGRPTVVLQEGGYATDALGDNAASFLSGLWTAATAP